MFDFLCQFYHLPGRLKDRLISLFLPELDIKFPIRKSPFDEASLPSGLRFRVLCHIR